MTDKQLYYYNKKIEDCTREELLDLIKAMSMEMRLLRRLLQASLRNQSIEKALAERVRKMNKIPDKIYLQWYEDDGEPSEEVTWCWEEIVTNFDIEYIRADKASNLKEALTEIVLEVENAGTDPYDNLMNILATAEKALGE